jgi:hypothetical protein
MKPFKPTGQRRFGPTPQRRPLKKQTPAVAAANEVFEALVSRHG